MLGRAGLPVAGRDHLAQHPEQLHPHLVGRGEPVGRVGRAGLGQQPVERVVLLEQRRRGHRRQRGDIRALVAAELHRQHHQRAADGVDVGGHGRADPGHLGRLVADGAVDRGVEVVEAAHPAHVDQLDRVADLDDVVRLEVAVDQAHVVQVLERRQDLDDVGDGLVDRQRVVAAARRPHPRLEQRLQRGAADVLHDDVARALVHDEVVDLDDQRVLDLGQELLLGDRGGHGVGVTGVEQALEHDPAAGDVAVAGEVDPAEPAVGDRAGHLVLAADEVAGPQLGVERERVAALRAEALGAPGLAVARAPDRGAAGRADPLVLGDLGVLEDRLGRVDRGDRRDGGEARAEPRAAQPGGGGADPAGDADRRCRPPGRTRGRWRPAGWTPGRRSRVSRRARPRTSRRSRHPPRRGAVRAAVRGTVRSRRGEGRRAAADVAVAVHDLAGAPRLGAGVGRHGVPPRAGRAGPLPR